MNLVLSVIAFKSTVGRVLSERVAGDKQIQVCNIDYGFYKVKDVTSMVMASGPLVCIRPITYIYIGTSLLGLPTGLGNMDINDEVIVLQGVL